MRSLLLITLVSLSLLAAVPADAGTLLSQTFDTDTTSTAQTESAYPDFTFDDSSGASTFIVSGGVLRVDGPSNGNQTITRAGFDGDIVISADIGETDGAPGSGHVALLIGGNAVVYHPGLTGGQLRVEGNGGFGNQDMGFTPATNALHRFEVTVTAATGLFELTVTDANNASNVYTNAWTNLVSVGGTIGFRRSANASLGLFDNLTVTGDAVPEPAGASLLLACALASARRARDRAARAR